MTTGGSSISGMSTPEDWEDRDRLLNYLAQQLLSQRISLFMGAGVSAALSLPNWTALIDGMHCAAGVARPIGLGDTQAAEALYVSQFGGDRIAFAKNVQRALYSKGSLTAAALDSNPLLSALGALVMSSVRGHAANVVTFNYDDLLETYLANRGFAVESVDILPKWSSLSDVTVLHPHGLLPSDMSDPQRGVVLTQLDFDEIVGDTRDLWRQKVTSIMRSTTPIFVGLSGNDANLTSMMAEVNKLHSKGNSILYWGVRLGLTDDLMSPTWAARGVFHHPLNNHADAAPFIMEVCRRAAARRLKAIDY